MVQDTGAAILKVDTASGKTTVYQGELKKIQ